MRTPLASGRRRGGLVPALCAILAACGGAEAGGTERVVTVGAAASLRDLLTAAAEDFERAHPGTTLRLSFEASSSIARKLRSGGAFDAFLSADAATVELVRPLLDEGTIAPFLENRLALVAAPSVEDAPEGPRGLAAAEGWIAVGGPAVPAGRYARRLLEREGLLEAVEPRFVLADDVRAALGLVDSGAAAFGFVYETDARAAKRCRIVWRAPADSEDRVVYVAGAVEGSAAGAELVAWLHGAAFRELARAHGFGAPPD